MMKAKLNFKFYIVFALLLGSVVLAWYGIYFLNANEILVEDGSPLDASTKMLFTILTSLVAISWTISLFTLLRQIIVGSAFYMDKDGIHTTATAFIIFAFIFIVPIKTIPYDAIDRISVENGVLSMTFDKSKIEVFPIFKPLVRKEYHFFLGYTSEKQSEIKQTIDVFMENHRT